MNKSEGFVLDITNPDGTKVYATTSKEIFDKKKKGLQQVFDYLVLDEKGKCYYRLDKA